jgi:uncharacterized membrane protein YfcA
MAALYLLLGIVAGVFSGIIGIGGGILIIPALTYFFHQSQHKAQGTSLGALLAPIGLLAFLAYHRAGNVDVKAALLIAGAFWSAAISAGSGHSTCPTCSCVASLASYSSPLQPICCCGAIEKHLLVVTVDVYR